MNGKPNPHLQKTIAVVQSLNSSIQVHLENLLETQRKLVDENEELKKQLEKNDPPKKKVG